MENIREIKKEELLAEGKKFLDAGGKFVTAVCSDLNELLEVTYFFSLNSVLK
jgi:putative intracellular protease/amidase